ncbi:sugar transporter [Pyricularia oryzae Y34]|uniref:Sugar transporter n=1 Tax=Pyricularia oryzae (strain Y34) TaxID=1143189 RepID=A0AA97P3S2_PYRO3|nr:sugar transporter [Pyricularia oryzae Y34]
MVSSTRAYNWYVCMVAAMAMVLYGYDASVFNSVQGSDHWLEWFDLNSATDAYMIGLINTAYTIGAIISGFFIGGPAADYFGRRWAIFGGCATTVVATFMQAFAPYHNIGVFIAGRVVIGLGQGLALTAGPVYINEMAPAEIRGVVMTFWQLFYSVGSFICFWTNYACSQNRTSLGHWDWRTVVILQALVPVIIMALIPWIPESPRWHIQRHGDVEGARAALRKVRETEEEVEVEVATIREAIEYEKELSQGSSYKALFRDASVRKRLYLAMVLNVGQQQPALQLTGQGTLNSYSTAIYKKVWPDVTTINLINALNATFGIIFTLNAAWTADRFGRRWLFIVGAIGMSLCMLAVPVVGLATPDIDGGRKTQPVGIAIVFLLFMFALFYKPSWGATTWIWTAEVFSMNVRAQAVGMCSQMQNVANTIFQQFFPKFLQDTGLKCLFFFMAINIVLAVFVYFLIPETKKAPLEEMDVLFGGVNHVDQGAEKLGLDDNKAVTTVQMDEETAGSATPTGDRTRAAV